MRKPYVVHDSMGFTVDDYRSMQKKFGIQDKITDQNVAKILQQQDYDGIIAEDASGNIREVVAFEPTQIKSATDNIGTFDGSNPDIRYKLPVEEKDNQTSTKSKTYSYDTLVGKPDMKIIEVGGNIPSSRADIVAQAKKNATKVGKFDPKTGSVSVYVDDIDTDVVLGTVGLKHGLDRRNETIGLVTLKAGEILQSSIRVNELTPKKAEADASYVLIGMARDANGELLVVRSLVNRFSHELTTMDVLYAINAKKGNRLSSMLPGFQGPVTDSTISIADLLDYVNAYFPDILPEDVLKHYGYDSRPEGVLGADALYKLPVAEDTSPRTLLANALESLASDDKERSKIAEYKAMLETMEAEEAKLRELNAQIKELSFAEGKRDMEKIRKLRDEARKTTNRINIYDKQLLRLEAAKPLQKVLERERKRAYDRAKQKNKEAMAEYKKSVDEKFDAITQQYREQRKEAVAKVRETSAKRDVRQKILSFKKRMEKRLLRPTDTQYVPAGLAQAMVEVCELINTDTDLYKADGSINKAQERRNLTKEKLSDLAAEYKKLATHSDPAYQGEFDETFLAYLEQLRDDYAGKNLSDLTLDELRDMYDILRSIEETLQDAKKLIGWGENEGVYEAGDAIISEQAEIIRNRKNGKRNAAQKDITAF